MKKRVVLLGFVVVALASATAYAQMPHGPSMTQSGRGVMHDQMKKKMDGKMRGMHGGQGDGHGSGSAADGHGTMSGPQGDQGASSAAFHAINKKMHEGMNI